MLFASVLRTWTHDEDPGQARTMAALDRALARGQRFAGFLDDLCHIPSRLCRLRSRRRHRDEDSEKQPRPSPRAGPYAFLTIGRDADGPAGI